MNIKTIFTRCLPVVFYSNKHEEHMREPKWDECDGIKIMEINENKVKADFWMNPTFLLIISMRLITTKAEGVRVSEFTYWVRLTTGHKNIISSILIERLTYK